MEHVVFFPAPDGSPAFRRLASLEEAVRLVEHLRNVEGVSAVSVHALTEVPLAFRAYYRVEVPSASGADRPYDAPVPVAPPVAVEPVAVESVQVEQPAPLLALVEELPAAEPAQAPVAEIPVAEIPVAEQEPQPALVSSNGHGTPASLGFFA